MSAGRDPLDDLMRDLRDEWRRSGAPRELPPESLEACDDATRASVEWLRRAWALQHTVEPGAVPAALRRAHRARERHSSIRRLRRPAAAALVLAAAAAALLLVARPWTRGQGEADGVQRDDSPMAAVESPRRPPPGAGAGLDPAQVEREPVPRMHARTRSFPPEQFRSRPDGVEVVSGNVRLVLVERDASQHVERDASQHVERDASQHVERDASQHAERDASVDDEH